MFKRLSSFGFSLAILGGAVAVIFLLFATRSSPEPVENKVAPTIVTLQDIQPQAEDIQLEAFGVVRAANEANLQAQISARIIDVHPALRVGGIIPAGEPAIRLEKGDFEAAVARAKAQVASARALLALEEGRGKVAEREAELVSTALPDIVIDEQLALRGPQLAEAKARVEQALSDLQTAQLNLKRTEITLPFDALVLEETADIGDFASPGANLGAVADISQFWVEAELPQAALKKLRAQERRGSIEAKIYPDPTSTEGRLARVISLAGSLSNTSRQGVALIAIDAPLSLSSPPENGPEILLGAYVKVQMNAGQVQNVVVAPRSSLRENKLVAVRTSEDILAFREVTVAHERGEQVYLQGAFLPGDQLVTSRLSTAIPGALLKTTEEMSQDRQREQQREDAPPKKLSWQDQIRPVTTHITYHAQSAGQTLAQSFEAAVDETQIVFSDFSSCLTPQVEPCHETKKSIGTYTGRRAATLKNWVESQFSDGEAA